MLGWKGLHMLLWCLVSCKPLTYVVKFSDEAFDGFLFGDAGNHGDRLLS